MAKKVDKIRVRSVKNPNNVKYIIPRLANNTMFMRENGYVIDDEPETLAPLKADTAPVETKKGDESNVNEYADLSAGDLVKKINAITTVKVLEKIESMELNRGDDARKTVLKALDKRFNNLQ